MQKIKSLPTVLLLSPFVFSFAFAMDLYIPVVAEMKDFFQTSQANIQLTLSLFMFAGGIGQLFAGPLSDQFGRRKIIIISILFFTLGSLLCTIANSIDLLIIGRIIESLGGCGMLVGSFAIVRDKFSGNDVAKMISFLNCGIAISPLFAPIIGGYLADWFGWRAEFIFLTVLGALLFFLALFKIKESLPAENRIKFDTSIFLRYWHILTNCAFLPYAICASAGLTVFFTFFSSSPYIIINLLHVPIKHFGYYFFILGITFFIGSLISGKVASKMGAFYTVVLGTFLMLAAGAIMFFWYRINGLSTVEFLLPCTLAGVAGSLMMGAGAGGAIEPFGDMAGSAGALVGFLQFFISSAIGSYVMHWEVTSTTPLALTMIGLSMVTLAILGLTFRSLSAETMHIAR